jgi:hypothetical protein
MWPGVAALIVSMKLKRIAKVAGVVVCAFVLLAVLHNGLGSGFEFVFVPKWGFSVGQLEVGFYKSTNGVTQGFTNRITHIGPFILTEFNH